MKQNDLYCAFRSVLNGNRSYSRCMVFTARLEIGAWMQAFRPTGHPLSQKLREVLPPQRQFDSNWSEFVDVSFSYKNPRDPETMMSTQTIYHFCSYGLLVLLVCSLSYGKKTSDGDLCAPHGTWELLQLTTAWDTRSSFRDDWTRPSFGCM